MKERKSPRKIFNDLTKTKKAQIIAASLLSVILLIGVPTYAWFSYTTRVEALTRIRTPYILDIRSGHSYSIQHLSLSDIDVNSNIDGDGNGYKDYIFTVKAGNSPAYDIQLAHTTNIPFTYTIYRASELGNSVELNTTPSENVATFEYHDVYTSNTITYYYGYASSTAASETRVTTADEANLSLTDLNPDAASASAYGRTIAENEDGADEIYSKYTEYKDGDDPEIYAVPLYSQHLNVPKWNAEGDYFILRISWNISSDNSAFAAWNKADNNKETDVVYISTKLSVTSAQ